MEAIYRTIQGSTLWEEELGRKSKAQGLEAMYLDKRQKTTLCFPDSLLNGVGRPNFCRRHLMVSPE